MLGITRERFLKQSFPKPIRRHWWDIQVSGRGFIVKLRWRDDDNYKKTAMLPRICSSYYAHLASLPEAARKDELRTFVLGHDPGLVHKIEPPQPRNLPFEKSKIYEIDITCDADRPMPPNPIVIATTISGAAMKAGEWLRRNADTTARVVAIREVHRDLVE